MNPYEEYFQSQVRDVGNKKFEFYLLGQIKNGGLKQPEREFRFHAERKWRFDFAYPEEKVAIEVEGGVWSHGRHTRGYGFEADCEKYNEAALAGWLVFRFTPKMVMDLRAIRCIEKVVPRAK